MACGALHFQRGVLQCPPMATARSNWPSTSRHSRGYGAEWNKTRKRILERDGHKCQCPQCSAADQRGERRLNATHVDHRVSREKAQALGWSAARTESDENLQSMNETCHQRKTFEERGLSAPKPQRIIGADGYPV